MSEEKNINVLENFISKPQSLEAQRVGHTYFLDNHAQTIPNEGNLLSLMTLKEFYKSAGGGTDEEKALQNIGKEESKYLIEAMKILSDTAARPAAGSVAEKRWLATRKMQQKFGKDFNSALGLSQMLKTKAEEVEFNSYIEPLVKSVNATLNVGGRAFI